MIDTQRPGFEELHKAFLDFFMAEISRDASPWNKIRLQMMSQYFDDLALYKVINPIIQRIHSNPEDRRAIARAALWDAWHAHQMGLMFSQWTSLAQTPDRLPVTVVSAPQPVVMVPEATTTASSGGVTRITIKAKRKGRRC